MKTYILVGETAVNHFLQNDFQELETAIDVITGDIISFDKETESITTLLDMLRGWNDFIELSANDIQEIKQNTNIEFDQN
ncbi:MAG: hypothetical protein EKK64_10700 [Neisseriaceae bacterium]|nr:MAG: hypothetical protein EKK64_10700 [Neisseriaceae bacterium]